jgi:predicted ester cyclase
MEDFMHSSLQKQQLKDLGWKRKFLLALVICWLVMFGLSGSAMAGRLVPLQAIAQSSVQSSPQSSQANKAIALRYAQEGWGTQSNWEAVWDELVASDVVLHFNSFPEPIVGLEANKEFSKGLFEGFPAIKNTIEDVVAEGDRVIIRSTLEGKQTGPFLGMPATDKRVKMNDFTLYKISGGKISEMWYETNLLSLMQQLGLAPELT